MLIDSHAHLTDERIHPDVDAVVERARAAGLVGIVSVATGPDDWGKCLDLAARFPDVYATAGVHPHAARDSNEETLARVGEMLAGPRVVAVGETGLDYHYDFSPRGQQRESFARHLELSRASGKPR
jgi:TatD DNase family protein